MEDPTIRRAVFASVDSDALIGELARRGTLVLHVDNMSAPAGIALEDVERARRALPLADHLDLAPGERPVDLEIATPAEVEGHISQHRPASWTALLYRAFAVVVWAGSRNERRQALVDLAALAVRWAEALDARADDDAQDGER